MFIYGLHIFTAYVHTHYYKISIYQRGHYIYCSLLTSVGCFLSILPTDNLLDVNNLWAHPLQSISLLRMAAEIEEQMTWWLPSFPVKVYSTDLAACETLTKKKP